MPWGKTKSKTKGGDDPIWKKYKSDYGGGLGTLEYANMIIQSSEDTIQRKAAFYFLIIDNKIPAEDIISMYDLCAEEAALVREYESVFNDGMDPNNTAGGGLVAPRTFSLRADDGRVMYSNVFTRKCSERRTFMRGGTALDLYVQPGAQFRGHHWRTMLKTMYADKLPSKFDLYQAHGKVDMAALVNGNMTINKV